MHKVSFKRPFRNFRTTAKKTALLKQCIAFESGFSSSDVFTFDLYPYLYVKTKDFMKIKQDSKIQRGPSEMRADLQRISNSGISALVLRGMMSPLDFRNYIITRHLLKKQTLFAYKLTDTQYKWTSCTRSLSTTTT